MSRETTLRLNEFLPSLTVSGVTQTHIDTQSAVRANEVMTGDINRYAQPKRAPVYEVVSGQPTWGKLYRLACESTAHLAVNSIVRAIKTEGRCTTKCETALAKVSNHLNTELPAAIVRDILNVCLARDRFRCHHNPTDCLALELWRVFYNPKFTDVSVVHHEFAFPKTTNYPDIVQNLEHLFSLISETLPNPPSWKGDYNVTGLMPTEIERSRKHGSSYQSLYTNSSYTSSFNTGEHVVYDNCGGINAGHDDNQSITSTKRGFSSHCSSVKCNAGEKSKLDQINEIQTNAVVKNNFATISSFKLELKHCEVGCFLQDRVVACVAKLADGLRILEIPGHGSDELLHVIALYCTNLEVLNVAGSREQVSDPGFARYIETSAPEARSKLRQLDISRCMLSQRILLVMQALTALRDLRISTRVFDEISYNCDGQSVVLTVNNGSVSTTNTSGITAPLTSSEHGGLFTGDGLMGLGRASLPAIESVTVENENIVQVSVNQVMTYLRHMFPNAKHVALSNCIACELHVTLTQHPTNITYMRQHIHTLELISADYFNFPRLVYPCPNLESLHIEKPTNDIFNIDAQNVPFLYGNTVPFVNLKVLRLSRISLTNLTHFLSRSSNLRSFKVTNIGRRERPRWTDERIKQILPPDSVPMLQVRFNIL